MAEIKLWIDGDHLKAPRALNGGNAIQVHVWLETTELTFAVESNGSFSLDVCKGDSTRIYEIISGNMLEIIPAGQQGERHG